jgi:hypothetical protein
MVDTVQYNINFMVVGYDQRYSTVQYLKNKMVVRYCIIYHTNNTE